MRLIARFPSGPRAPKATDRLTAAPPRAEPPKPAAAARPESARPASARPESAQPASARAVDSKPAGVAKPPRAAKPAPTAGHRSAVARRRTRCPASGRRSPSGSPRRASRPSRICCGVAAPLRRRARREAARRGRARCDEGMRATFVARVASSRMVFARGRRWAEVRLAAIDSRGRRAARLDGGCAARERGRPLVQRVGRHREADAGRRVVTLSGVVKKRGGRTRAREPRHPRRSEQLDLDGREIGAARRSRCRRSSRAIPTSPACRRAAALGVSDGVRARRRERRRRRAGDVERAANLPSLGGDAGAAALAAAGHLASTTSRRSTAATARGSGGSRSASCSRSASRSRCGGASGARMRRCRARATRGLDDGARAGAAVCADEGAARDRSRDRRRPRARAGCR